LDAGEMQNRAGVGGEHTFSAFAAQKVSWGRSCPGARRVVLHFFPGREFSDETQIT